MGELFCRYKPLQAHTKSKLIIPPNYTNNFKATNTASHAVEAHYVYIKQ
jgi:hypothetical protein